LKQIVEAVRKSTEIYECEVLFPIAATRLFYDWVTYDAYEVIVTVEVTRQEKRWK